MFLRLFLTTAILCLSVRGEEQEFMNPNPDFLSYMIEHRMPTVFGTPACTPAATDLVFALDGSASINTRYFDAGKNLMKNSVKQLNDLGLIGSGSTQTRVGAFQFGEHDYESFPLLDTASEINQGIDGIFYQNSSLSKIADAVDWALTQPEFFGGLARGSANRVLVVLSDCLDNCDSAKEVSAKQKADAAGVGLLLVTYTPDTFQHCVTALTGGDPNKHLISASIDDVSMLTGCPPPETNVSRIECHHGGHAWCHCAPGWTGDTCTQSCCTRVVLYDGKYDERPLCGPHGTCVQADDGCSCDCKDGYTGKYCDKPPGPPSHRCILYDNPAYTGNVTYKCDLSHERCITDSIDCALNTPLEKDKDGKPYCPDSRRSPCSGYCMCKDPRGWCIPLPNFNAIVLAVSKAMVKTNKFIVPVVIES